MSIIALAIGVAKFLAEGTANHFLGKGLDKFFTKDEFQTELYKVIYDTLTEFEKKFPVQNEAMKFPFYHSEIIVKTLLKIALYKEDGDVVQIINELGHNSNIITPNENQILSILDLFNKKICENEKLKNLEIEKNYKGEIFNISNAIKQLEYSVENTIRKISTDLTAEWKRQLEVYKENIEQFKPQTALTLLEKLEQAIRDSDSGISDKIDSKLHYLKALCFELLLDNKNAQKEYLSCFAKDPTHPVYKEKVAFAYYSLENIARATELAQEIIQTDFDNPTANFILALSKNEEIFFNNIERMPDYVRKNIRFKYLVLSYIQKDKGEYPLLKRFLLDDYYIETTEKVSYENFFTSIYNSEYAYYVYMVSGLYFDFNERTESSPFLEQLHVECKNITLVIRNTELEHKYRGAFFLFNLTDYIVNDNVDSLLLSRSHIKDIAINSVILLANCLQHEGKEHEAIDVLSSQQVKYPEIFYLKAYCYAKLKDYVNYNIAINEFITLIDCLTVMNFERILTLLVSQFDEGQYEIIINIDLILKKNFELNIHKQIIENLSKNINDRNDANIDEMYKLATDSSLSINTKGKLAYILLKVNKPELSVSLYREFINTTEYNQDLFYYIQALYYTKKDNKELLALLKDWRQNSNHPDDFLFNIEYELRRQISDWKEALDIMRLLYSKYPYQETIFSNYLVCLHEMGESEKIQELHTCISSIKFSNLHCVRDVVIVLFQNDFIDEAFEVLYPFAIVKENSNMRMMFLQLAMRQPQNPILKKYETVKEDSFVLIRYEDTGEIKIIHIKENQINEMQKSLLDKKVGDKVFVKIPTFDMYKSIVILDIMNKYLALHYEIYHETDNPIDSNLPMTSFRLPDNCNIEDLNDFFIKNFAAGEEKRRQFYEEYLTKYVIGELPFSAIAAVLFNSDFFKTYSVLSSPKYGILLNPNLNDMKSVDITEKEFILDISAILCFYQLHKSIGLCYAHKFVISKSIYDFIQYKIIEAKAEPATKMTIDIDLNGITPTIFPDDYKEQLIKYYEDVRNWLEANCIVEIVEEKLDELRKEDRKDLDGANLAIDYLADYIHILNIPDRILISDDSLLHTQYAQSGKEISSQMYLIQFFDEDTINKELLVKNYIGVPISKDFLKTEFVNKLSCKENVYSQCLNSLCYLIPENKLQVIITVSLFLKDIYTDRLVIMDVNREAINLFVTVLRDCKSDMSVFVTLQKRLSHDFSLLGTKKDEVLLNLLGAMRILFPSAE